MSNAVALPEETSGPHREALAAFIQAHRAQIKARFRDRFAAGSMRFYDSSDFFATVSRRADLLTSQLDASASLDVRRMLRLIILEALQDCARTRVHEQRLRRELASAGRRPDAEESVELPVEADELRRLGLTGDDLNLARLRSSGLGHAAIATVLGMSVGAVRMRWHRLLERFRAQGGGRA